MPKAAPIDRENCTEAAASPSRAGPGGDLHAHLHDAHITVPMNSPLNNNIPASAVVPSAEDPEGERHQNGRRP